MKTVYYQYKRAEYKGKETEKALLYLMFSKTKDTIERHDKFIPKKFIVETSLLTISKWAHDNIITQDIKNFMKPKAILLNIRYDFKKEQHFDYKGNLIRNWIGNNYSPETIRIEESIQSIDSGGVDFKKLLGRFRNAKNLRDAKNQCPGCGIDLSVNYEEWCFHPEGCGKVKASKGLVVEVKKKEKKVIDINERELLF